MHHRRFVGSGQPRTWRRAPHLALVATVAVCAVPALQVDAQTLSGRAVITIPAPQHGSLVNEAAPFNRPPGRRRTVAHPTGSHVVARVDQCGPRCSRVLGSLLNEEAPFNEPLGE